jgi:hypothetical protein
VKSDGYCEGHGFRAPLFLAWFNFAPIMVTLMQLTMGGIVKRSDPPEPVEGLAMALLGGRETIANAFGLAAATRRLQSAQS